MTKKDIAKENEYLASLNLKETRSLNDLLEDDLLMDDNIDWEGSWEDRGRPSIRSLAVRVIRAEAEVKRLTEELQKVNNMKNMNLTNTLQACESALIAMVKQYCYRPKLQEDGKLEVYCHDFMSAGEEAFRYLVENGLAEYTENGVDIVFREDVKNG